MLILYYMYIKHYQLNTDYWVWSVNPILTGLFESKFLLGGGGGGNLTPLQISVVAKFCMDVKT